MCEYSKAAFDFWNEAFHINLKQWIKAKTAWWRPLRYKRLYGAWAAQGYYKAVQKWGWGAFVDCKEKLGHTEIIRL